MRRSVRAGVVAIATVALGLGLAGCGSDSNTDETSKPATSKAEASDQASPASPGENAGPKYTIVDYIRDNNITETPVKRGAPGAPTINLPTPPKWQDAGPAAPEWAYSAILYNDPAMKADPPTIIAIVSKLTGNVDPAKILEFAPGELMNLPGYQGAEKGSPSKLSGFDAVQLGGVYTKNGVTRAIAQKTVVIPGKDGLYVLQLNADGREDQMQPLMEATQVIDDQTTITP